MFQSTNKFVKAAIRFVIGCVLMLAAEWIVTLIKGGDSRINWISTICTGLLVAVLDTIFPIEQRQNREKLKNLFKR